VLKNVFLLNFIPLSLNTCIEATYLLLVRYFLCITKHINIDKYTQVKERLQCSEDTYSPSLCLEFDLNEGSLQFSKS